MTFASLISQSLLASGHAVGAPYIIIIIERGLMAFPHRLVECGLGLSCTQFRYSVRRGKGSSFWILAVRIRKCLATDAALFLCATSSSCFLVCSRLYYITQAIVDDGR